jgi:hypothetical protein
LRRANRGASDDYRIEVGATLPEYDRFGLKRSYSIIVWDHVGAEDRLLPISQPEPAISLIERGLRLTPHYPATPLGYYVLGMCRLRLDHIEAAVICLGGSLASNPRPWYSHFALAAALGLKGDLGKAATTLRQAIWYRASVKHDSSLLV